jgi:hypothetical protein
LRLAASGLAIVAIAVTLQAQTSSARLGGTVLDPSGAPVAQALVLCLNENTGTRNMASSDSRGSFLFPLLTPGLYTVSVEAKGFNRKVLHKFYLSVSEIANQSIRLEIGDVSTSLDVQADASETRVQTDDAQITRVVTSREIDTLPQLDRNPMVLATLQPGIAYDGDLSRINGTRQGSNNTSVDGISANDPIYPRLGFSSNSNNTDSVAEFRIVLNGGKAEYGRNAGGQVELITRSGTNHWSGNAFDYLRNTVLNANDFFNNSSGNPTPKLIQNRFGGSLGGPVRRNRTFFFANYQGTRAAQEVVRNRLVMTPEAKRGLFRWIPPGSSSIQSFDIVRNDPRGIGIDPQIAKLLTVFPNPNNFDIGDTLNNAGYRFNNPANASDDQVTVKVDHNLTDRNHLFFRYSQGRASSVDTVNGADARFPGQPAGTESGPTLGFSAGSDWTLTPHAVNELRAGRQNYSIDYLRPARIQGPMIQFPSALSLDPINTSTSYGQAAPVDEFTDNLTLARGRHTVKFGFNFQNTTQAEYTDSGIYPNITLSRSFGNIPPASIGPDGAVISAANRQRFEDLYNTLLGRPASISQSFYSNLQAFQPAGTPRVRNQVFRDYAGFVQDDWKIARRLTLNIGLRYELFGVPFEQNGIQGQFNKVDQINSVTPLSDLAIQRSNHYTNGDWNNFAPRFGFAFDPWGDGRTAIRGSYGIFYDRTIGALKNDVDLVTPGFGQTVQVFPNQSGTSDVRVSDGLIMPQQPAAPILQPPLTRGSTVILALPNLRTPYFQHWNFTVQRELLANTVLEAGYVSTRGVKLELPVNVDQPRIFGDFLQSFQQLQAFQATGAAVPASNTLVRIFGSPASAVSRLGASNFQLGAAGAAASALDQVYYPLYGPAGVSDFYLRLYPQFSGVLVGRNDGRSYYDSLQISVRRSTGHLKLNANYTFSKNIDNISFEENVPTDSFNLHYSRGLSDFNVPHNFNLSAIWTLPVGKGQRFGGRLPRWADSVAGGWDFGVIQTLQTGLPFTVSSGRATIANNSRANFNGDRSVGQVQREGDGVYYFTPQEAAAFSVPAAGDGGNSGRNSFHGPALWDVDASLVKRFRVAEGKTVTFRWEAYNALNRTGFGAPSTDLSNALTFGKIGGLAVQPRRMQVALRFDF